MSVARSAWSPPVSYIPSKAWALNGFAKQQYITSGGALWWWVQLLGNVDPPSCNNSILPQRHRGIFWIARKAIETLEYKRSPHVVHTSRFFDRLHLVERRENLIRIYLGDEALILYTPSARLVNK
jgi:hypothetical protein